MESLKKMSINSFRDLFNLFPDELKTRIYNLKNIPQNKKYHPEGNVLKHTIIVVNNALKSDNLNLAIAAMFHDIGKDETLDFNPKTGEPTAYGHEKISKKILKEYKNFIESIGGDFETILFIVSNHMKMHQFDKMKTTKQDILKANKDFDLLKQFSKYDTNKII